MNCINKIELNMSRDVKHKRNFKLSKIGKSKRSLGIVWNTTFLSTDVE